MSNFIDLARRFHKLSSTEMTDPDHLAMLSEGRFGSSMSWEDALDNPRLILLAEAGSGKTRELRERAARMTRDGKCVFFVPLEALSADRLEDILPPAQLRSFNEWKAAADQPAWFFLDAVDELKLKAGNIERAVRRLAKSVDGELHRCRFIISSRPNDWRPETDRNILEEHLPFVARDEVADAETYFLSPFRGSSLKNRRSRQAAPETRSIWQPIVLLPLSVDQTQAYARHLGLSDPTAFLAEIDRKDAWTFARRPFDLHDLVMHWKATGAIGTRMQQHELNITSKLREDPDKPGSDILSPEKARQGAERLALALQLTKCRTVRSVDLMPETDHDDGILDPDLPLPDWRLDERQSLLRRAVFDPATYGRIRFHHRSVQEYLAARRLLALIKQGTPRSAIRRMLFADRYGNRVLIPSMRPVAAWLALWEPDILQTVIDREPEVLLAHGDPEQLTIASRAKLLEAFVSGYGSGGWRGLDISSDNLQRLAHRDLGECIRTLWESRPENHDIYDLLAKLVLMGEVGSCSDLMYEASLSPDFNDYIRIVAIRALVACQAKDAAGAIATSMVTTPESWPARVIFDAVEDLFPDYMTVEDLLALVRRVREPKDAVGGFKWHLRQVAIKVARAPVAGRLMAGLADLIWEGRRTDQQAWRIRGRYDHIAASLTLLCREAASSNRATTTPALARAIVIAMRFGREHGFDREERQELRSKIGDPPGLREQLFWIDVEIMDELVPGREAWLRFRHTLDDGPLDDLREADRPWLEAAVASGMADRQAVAVEAILRLWVAGGGRENEIEYLKRLVAAYPDFKHVLDAFGHPVETPRPSPIPANDGGEEAYISEWREWREAVLSDPDAAFAEDRKASTIANFHRWLSRSDNSSWCAWNGAAVRSAFNDDIARRAADSFASCWRKYRPLTYSERQPEERNTMSWDWCYGLDGLAAEAESPGWAGLLRPEDAELAARYALLEMNGFSAFIDDVADAHPSEVARVFGAEIAAQFSNWDQNPQLPVVQDLRRAKVPLKKLLAPVVLEALVKASSAAGLGQGSMHTLESALTVLVDSGYAPDLVRDHVEHAFQSGPTSPYALTWLEALFRLAPERGLAALSEHLEKLGNASNETKAAPFAYLFGDRRGVLVKAEPDVKARILGELVRLAYRHVRREDDQTHEGTFSPDARDDAQSARNHLLSALIATPGPETCKVLQELASEHDFAHFPDRLRILARERAAEDTEFAPYGKDDLAAIERSQETVRTHEEFLAFVVDRMAEIDEFYQHHPFTNRSTIASIADEEEMQRTLAAQLEMRANGAYVVMRETEVADRKRTDIQLLAKGGLQAVIEVKLGNRNYSINDLEHAIEHQIVQQYLRSDVCRTGALVLTDHGTGRTWVHPDTRKTLNFAETIAHLRAKAASLAIAHRFRISIDVLGLRLGPPDLVPAQRAKATRSSRSKTIAAG